MTISVVLVAAFVVVLSVVGFASRSSTPVPAAESVPLVLDSSHRLSNAGEGSVTLVEFLDFECESCRAAYPVVEQIRSEYEGRLTVVARYFPIPSHANAENAAVAVEAAAQQGAFEAMYSRMYETQPQWGERRESAAALFRVFAEELQLDLTAYDRAVADPATMARVALDRDAGIALGVEGTPTFFLDGERIRVSSEDDLRTAIDDALAP